MRRKTRIEHETFEEWEEALELWLESLPAGDPVRTMDDIDKCAAFDKQRADPKRKASRK